MKAKTFAVSRPRFVLAGVVVAFASGCSVLPEPQADPTRFYVLSSSATAIATPANAPVVRLAQLDVASYLRARPVVVRRGNNEIEFREFARWGEPLDIGIGRVLREELLARGIVVVSGMRRDHPTFTHNLTVRVLSAEGATNGAVAFRAVWELAAAGDKPGPVASGDFGPADLRWDAKTEASLAAKLSEAVAGLAGEIAAGLKR